ELRQAGGLGEVLLELRRPDWSEQVRELRQRPGGGCQVLRELRHAGRGPFVESDRRPIAAKEPPSEPPREASREEASCEEAGGQARRQEGCAEEEVGEGQTEGAR